jgi:hypothetical protein
MPLTKPTAPSATKFAGIQEEVVALRQQERQLEEDVATTLLAGESTDEIAAKRAEIARHIDERGHALRALEPLVIREARAQLLANMEAAHERGRQQGAAVEAQKLKVAAAAAALDREELEYTRLQNQGSGSFSAQLELKAHREKYPGVYEPTL